MADKNSYLESAQRFLQKNQLDRAIKDYYRALELDPKDVRVRHKLGELLARFGSRAEALKELGLVAEAYAKDKFYLRAVAVYKQMVRLKEDLYDVHLRLGDLYRLASLSSEAMDHYKLVADYYESHGTSKECIEVFKKICDLLPDDLLARQKLAEYYVREERMEEAVALYKGVARAFQEKKQPDELLRIYDRLVQLEPAELSHYRLSAKVALELREPRRALARLQVCFKADPSDTETLLLLGETFASLEQLPKALQVYKELARLYDYQGSTEKVKDVYQRIRRFAPEDPDACQALGIKPAEALPALGVRTTGGLQAMPEIVVETARPITGGPVGSGGQTAVRTTASTGAVSPAPSGALGAGSVSPPLLGVRTTSPGGSRVEQVPGGSSQGFASVRGTGSGPTQGASASAATREPLMGRPVPPPNAAASGGAGSSGTLGRVQPVSRVESGAAGAGSAFVTPVERGAEPARPVAAVRSTSAGGVASLRAVPSSVSKLMTECEVYLKYQLTEKALAHLATILEREPGCYLAREKRRDLLQAVGRKAEAVQECEHMARLAQEAGDLNAAKHDLEVGLTLDPTHAGCLRLQEELKRPAGAKPAAFSTPIFTHTDGQVMIEVEDEEEDEDDAAEDEELASIALSDVSLMTSEDSDTFELVDDGPSALPFAVDIPVAVAPSKASAAAPAPAAGGGAKTVGSASTPVKTPETEAAAIEDMLDDLVDDGASFPSVYLSLGEDALEGAGPAPAVSGTVGAGSAGRAAEPVVSEKSAPKPVVSAERTEAKAQSSRGEARGVGADKTGSGASAARSSASALTLGQPAPTTVQDADAERSFEQRVSMAAPGASGVSARGPAGGRSSDARFEVVGATAAKPDAAKSAANQWVRGGVPSDPLAGAAPSAAGKASSKPSASSIRGGKPQGAALELPPRPVGASGAVHLNVAGTPATETGLRAPSPPPILRSARTKEAQADDVFELFGDEPSVPEDTLDGLDLVAELERELSFTSAEVRNSQASQRSSRSVERSLDVARAYMQMGLMDEALKELERCRQQGPLGVEATRLMGQCHFKRGNLPDAVHWFQAVLNRNDLTETQELEALFELAMVYEAQNDRARALDLLDEISSLNEHFRPADVAARRTALSGSSAPSGSGSARSGAPAPLR